MYSVNVVILGEDLKNRGFFTYFKTEDEAYRFVAYLKKRTKKKELITRNIMIVTRWETEDGVRTIQCV